MILGMKVKGKKMPGCPACFIILLLYLVTVQSFVAPLETSPEKDWKTVIENAPPGSKILMRGGIYTGFCNVNVPNNVVLKGESNTTSPVVIDCQSASRHFTVPSGSKCHLEDIALVNGRVNGDGGCILVDGGGAELSLVRVTLKNCKATGGGGAISLVSSTAKIENSDIIDSEAWEGGGIFADRSLVIVVDTSITFNTALYMGGGIRAKQASTLIARGSRTTISHNIGSGIYFECSWSHRCTASLSDGVSISHNRGILGGVSLGHTEFTADHCIITNNTAEQGGGFYLVS